MGDFNLDNFDSPFTMDSPFAPADETAGKTPRGNNTSQAQQQQTAQTNHTQQTHDQQQYDYSQYYYGATGGQDAGQVDYQSYYYQGQTENGYYCDPNQQYDYSQYYYGQEYAYGEEQAQEGYDAFQQIQQEVDAAQQQLQNTGANNASTQKAQPTHQTPAATSVTPQYQQPVKHVAPVEDPKTKLFARVSTQNEEDFKAEFPRVGIVDFYEKDSDANIRYEDPGHRIISSTTLPKLIEKLTSSQAGKNSIFQLPPIIYFFRIRNNVKNFGMFIAFVLSCITL